MNRRKALGNISKGIGTVIVTPTIVSIFQRCQSSKTFNPTFFKAEDFNLISRLMEIIIPKTDIPGAMELKLPEFVDSYIDAVWDKKSKENINKSLQFFKDEAKIKFGQKPIRDLTNDDLDQLLSKFLKSKDVNSDKEKIAASFTIELRNLTIDAFRTNEYIGENVLAYLPVPGKNVGCVDLDEATGGKAWSLQ
ncbi:MAG: gluconate 2-dehydrogenase subunit 3 family protein [Flavobacteriaceae bacterium]|tara:strand:- start:101 stop:679 length:579 start_codon:yes stop_codon:yes gene_type:complete